MKYCSYLLTNSGLAKPLRKSLRLLAVLVLFFMQTGCSNWNTKDKDRQAIYAYIKQNRSTDVALKNADFLSECEKLFNENAKNKNLGEYAWQPGKRNLIQVNDSLNNEYYYLFTPEFLPGYNFSNGDTLVATKYLKPVGEYGPLINYSIKFLLDSNHKVVSIRQLVSCRNYDENIVNRLEITDYDEEIALSKFALESKIKAQRKLVKQTQEAEVEAAKRTALSKQQTEDFKEHCLSGWDGACPALRDYVKENLKDPDSYEHIETGFWNKGDYALVMMKYRAKNSFGAYDVGYVKAKVSWECELIEIVEAGNL